MIKYLRSLLRLCFSILKVHVHELGPPVPHQRGSNSSYLSKGMHFQWSDVSNKLIMSLLLRIHCRRWQWFQSRRGLWSNKSFSAWSLNGSFIPIPHLHSFWNGSLQSSHTNKVCMLRAHDCQQHATIHGSWKSKGFDLEDKLTLQDAHDAKAFKTNQTNNRENKAHYKFSWSWSYASASKHVGPFSSNCLKLCNYDNPLYLFSQQWSNIQRIEKRILLKIDFEECSITYWGVQSVRIFVNGSPYREGEYHHPYSVPMCCSVPRHPWLHIRRKWSGLVDIIVAKWLHWRSHWWLLTQQEEREVSYGWG